MQLPEGVPKERRGGGGRGGCGRYMYLRCLSVDGYVFRKWQAVWSARRVPRVPTGSSYMANVVKLQLDMRRRHRDIGL